jgi:hypothetical protein
MTRTVRFHKIGGLEVLQIVALNVGSRGCGLFGECIMDPVTVVPILRNPVYVMRTIQRSEL